MQRAAEGSGSEALDAALMHLTRSLDSSSKATQRLQVDANRRCLHASIVLQNRASRVQA